MSREDLRAMLTEMAEDVPARQLVGPALARAATIRRRRRALVSAALAVVVVAGVGTGVRVTLAGPAGPESPAPTSPRGTLDQRPDGPARIDRLPSTLTRDPEASPYWPGALDLLETAPRLADAPLSHAVAIYSPNPTNAANSPQPVYAYGEGSINGSGDGKFHWVRLEVSLSDTRDTGGNRTLPLKSNSLGPMGRRAAFPQPDAVVVVELLTGATSSIPVTGINEDVSWLPDGRHLLVSTRTETRLVDTDTRSVVPVTARGPAVTPLVGAATGLTTLDMADGPVLRRYDAAGVAEQGQRAVIQVPSHRIDHLNGRGWRYGNLVAQAAGGQVGSAPGDFVAVIDDRTGAVSYVLDLGAGRDKGCCSVLGWRNSTEVLVYTAKEGLLVWRLTDGTVSRLTGPAGGVISVAPMGCDWSVTVAGNTASCIT